MPANSFPRYTTWIGHLTFAVLAVLAVWFFKERTVILDAAFQSFEVIKRGWFAIQVNRYGAAMTQVFPLLASKIRLLSLPQVLTIYSLSFVLVHWLMFVICDQWIKVKALGFAIVLFNVFMVNNTFYWVQNEIIQAISLNFVFWAWLVKLGSWRQIKWYLYPVLVFLIVTIAFFHPLTIFPFLFVAGYFLLDSLEKKQLAIQRSLNLMAVAVFGASLSLKYTAFPNTYDLKTTGRFSHNNIQTFFTDPSSTVGFRQFMEHLPIDFYFLPIALALITVFYFWEKLILKLLYVWGSSIALLCVVMISYIKGGDWFHIESQYLPVSVFLVLPLAWEVLPDFALSKKGLKWTVVGLSAAIFIRIADMVQTSSFYEKRLAYIGSTLQKTWPLKGKKFIMGDDILDKDTLLQSWSFGYETLYYSALQSPDSTRTIAIFSNLEKQRWRLSNHNSFMAYGNTVRFNDLPRHLFNFTDTTENYRLLVKEDFEK
jgi:hypothetical protein